MEENKNKEKKLIIEVDGGRWERHLVKTHFIQTTDNFEVLVEKYVLPFVKNNDIIIFCQKIVSIIQNRIVYKKDIKVGFFAKFLSKFVKKTPAGFSVGNPLKMQLAINLAGLPRILFASFFGLLFKIFGITGMFYRLTGHQISEIDGFYGEAYSQYAEMGILGPKGCDLLCDNLKEKFSFSFAVADVNDLGGNILGASKELKGKEKLLLKILKDNPAGQSNGQTPIVILRKENAN
ncbi:MAG: F420-0--gamma-glutamyl ligase [bacterium]|nr:F420-0--gamma-glutamyl ligase [bacterium]